MLLQSRFLHPNGQIPAYEWNFGDTNSAGTRARSAANLRHRPRAFRRQPDLTFLRRVYHKLTLNFTWWINRQDAQDRNIFEGGFLGLDNISLFNRSGTLPEGGHLDQADGTAWAAVYALNLMRLSIELALDDHVYEDMAIKFFEHFLLIAGAVHREIGTHHEGLWDEHDGFYYDLLEIPEPGRDHPARALDGRAHPAVRRRAAARRHLREAAGFRCPRALALRQPAGAGASSSRAGTTATAPTIRCSR